MTSKVAIWAGGVAGSALVHGVVLTLLLRAVDPEQVTEQPMPTSEIEVQSHQLERTTAREQHPDSHPTDTDDASGTSVAAGAIAQSRASAVEAASDALDVATAEIVPLPQVQRNEAINDVQPAPDTVHTTTAPMPMLLPPIAEPTSQLVQIQPVATLLTTASAPEQVIPAVVQTALVLPPAAKSAPTLAQVLPTAALLTTASAPEQVIPAVIQPAQALPPIAKPDRPALAVVPDAAFLPQAAPAAQTAQQAQPTARKLKAALAFSGGGEDEIDPVSLAAFQSFMQPGDVKVSGDALRDGVAALLAQVPCSRLQVGFDPDTATLQVNGHIPENDLRGPVLAALRTQMGTDISVSDKMLILPRPQCGALAGIADIGLPQSTDQNTNPLVIGEDAHVKVLEFVRNDRLFFDITAPDYDAWVYVDYFDADGNVLHLAPNDQVPLALSSAESAMRIGTKQAEDIGLQLIVGPPYGQEITVAFAASEPLYHGLRPIIEPAADYLEWLKSRVAAARTQHYDFKGEWVYFFVTTSEQ